MAQDTAQTDQDLARLRAQLDHARKLLAGLEQMSPPSVSAAVACCAAAVRVARAAGAMAKARRAPEPKPAAPAAPAPAPAPAPALVPKPAAAAPKPVATAPAPAAAKQPAPPAAAAAAAERHALELLPAADDGASAAVAGVPSGWGAARLSAFLERTGVKPTGVDKAAGETRAVARFSGPADRARARQALIDMGAAAAAGLSLVLPAAAGAADATMTTTTTNNKRPASSSPTDAAPTTGARGGKVARPGDGDAPTAAAANANKAAAASSDVRAAVCPWFEVPYGEQLRRKAGTVLESLRRAAEGVQGIYDSRAASGTAADPAPAWLRAAAERRGGAAAPLPCVVRAPQLEGYRSKSEFSVGRDLSGQPAVGFLHGSFKDGVTAVGDPGRARHTSPAARRYAALLQQFLRGEASSSSAMSGPSALDAWDKASNTGFWRLLLVREGRAATFLPLPEAGGAAAPAGTASPESLAAVPLERWLVRLPESQFGGAAAAEGDEAHLAVVAFKRLLEEGQGAEGAEDGAAPPPPPALEQIPPLLEPSSDADAKTTNAAEPRAPPPDELMLAVQVNPLYVKNRADPKERAELAAAAARELRALAAFLFASAAADPSSLPAPTSLLVQYHFGVSNAAPADAPLMPLEKAALDFDAMAAGGDGNTAPETAAAPINALPGAPPLASGPGSVDNDPQCLHETLCGLRFRVSPAAFFQVNAPATCLLYRLVGDWASPGGGGSADAAAATPPCQLLLDVCCGTGTIGVSLAPRAAQVVGVDTCAPAIEDAKRNAAANPGAAGKCVFEAATAESALPRILRERGGSSLAAGAVVAVADPPRAGLHKNVLRSLLAATSLKRLVLVSCNPASLSDNLVELCRPAWSRPKAGGGGGGSRGGGRGGGRGGRGGGKGNKDEVEVPADAAPFRPVLSAAVDLFPHTPHVEAVVLLERD